MVGNTAPKRWRVVVDALAVLTLIALLLSAWALYSRFTESNASRSDNQHTWHAVICSIEQQVLTNHTLTLADKQDALKFYDGLLIHNVGTTGCGYTVRLPRR